MQEQKIIGAACFDCGTKYGSVKTGVCTWWNGKCGICDKEASITANRNWGIWKSREYFDAIRREEQV